MNVVEECIKINNSGLEKIRNINFPLISKHIKQLRNLALDNYIRIQKIADNQVKKYMLD